jgi:hypothetical protein
MKRTAFLAGLLLFIAACGPKEPLVTPSPSSTVPSAPSAAAPPASASAEPAPEPKKRKPFEVYNGCTDVVTIVFAEDPNAATAGKRTIAPSATIEGPRNDDGNQTVWLLDANSEPLVKVRVTRGMKRVEVGRSCRTLDSH